MMLLEMAEGGFGDRVAIGDASDGLRFGELLDLVGRVATWLREHPADRLVFTDTTSEMLTIALFASAWAGKPFVPLNYRLADERLQSLISRQAPAAVLCTPGSQYRIGEHPGIDVVATTDLRSAIDDITVCDRDWSYESEAVAILLHTSGTSGDPKIAVLRHRHLVSYVIGSVEFMGADPDEAMLVSVPPYHIAGLAAILTATYAGRRMVQLATFEPTKWVRLAREQNVTHTMVVPTMLARIVEVLDDGDGLPALRHLSYGGGRMPLPIIEKAMTLLPHVDFVNAYGLTETSSSIAVLGPDEHREAMASTTREGRRRLASVGKPLPTVEIEIRDAQGEVLGPHRTGEVYVRGEQVSGEYAHTSAGRDDGWFATHDGGYFDDDGFLFVEGRIDDVIVRGGENLSPGEIEDVLLSHPAVHDAVVVGIPDDEWGEVVAAVVVLHEGQRLTAAEVQHWVVSHLRSSRTPSLVEFRSELPYNDTGKLLRRVVRAELAERAN